MSQGQCRDGALRSRSDGLVDICVYGAQNEVIYFQYLLPGLMGPPTLASKMRYL